MGRREGVMDMASRLVLSDHELAKMGTPVQKGVRLPLGDIDKQPRRIVGGGWDELKIQGVKVDLDLVTLLLTVDNDVDNPTESGFYVASRDRIVHYNPRDRRMKVRDASGAVEYQGDSIDGSESKDEEDETMVFDYSLLPPDVAGLVTFVNIHKQGDSPDFVQALTFDQIDRPFVSSWPEGRPDQKRVTKLNDGRFAGTDTIIVKFDWRKPDGTWEEEFVEQHVAHRSEFQGRPNAGFLSAVAPYGVG
ncbi:MAG TPA: TerD family protein [Candidatus Saccharimonadales bacterium]|nr:TerD family protein [Candidatus Saccharimonadales bacterium]